MVSIIGMGLLMGPSCGLIHLCGAQCGFIYFNGFVAKVVRVILGTTRLGCQWTSNYSVSKGFNPKSLGVFPSFWTCWAGSTWKVHTRRSDYPSGVFKILYYHIKYGACSCADVFDGRLCKTTWGTLLGPHQSRMGWGMQRSKWDQPIYELSSQSHHMNYQANPIILAPSSVGPSAGPRGLSRMASAQEHQP